jgi:peptidoglycan/LPS O-acetylase OafA/YrhL
MTYNASGAFGSGQTARDAVPSILTYWNNVWAALHRTQLIDAPSPVAVYWSLSTEEQFYLLFPLMLTVLTRPRWRAAVLVLLIVVQFPLSRPVWSTGWLVRSDAIAWGVCLYLFAQTSWHRRFEPTFLRSPWTAAAIAAVAVLLLGVLVALPREWAGIVAPFPGTVGIIALACAVLVFVASYDRDYVLSIPGLRRGLDWFGTRSYGLYLAHLPVYMASREFWYRIAMARGEAFDLRWAWVLVATGIVALVVVTEVLHRTVESPLRQRGRRWAAKIEGRARGAQVGTLPG